MKHAITTTLICSVLSIATPGFAAPAFDAKPPKGFVIKDAKMVMTETGLDVSGAVCRLNRNMFRMDSVTIEQIGTDGTVLNSTSARLFGARSQRSNSCAFYAADTAWSLSKDDTIRITPTN